jgi:hypothetical protein
VHQGLVALTTVCANKPRPKTQLQARRALPTVRIEQPLPKRIQYLNETQHDPNDGSTFTGISGKAEAEMEAAADLEQRLVG